MTIIAFKVDNRDAEIAALREEVAALREEVAVLWKEKLRLCDVLFETTNALIRTVREKR